MGIGAACLCACTLAAQQFGPPAREVAFHEEASLPDAPGSSAAWQTANLPQAGQQTGAAQQAAGQPATAPPQIAKRFATTIKPGETALPLSAGDKWQIAVRKQLTLGSLASPLISAGFGNLNNSRPHYGTDSGAFGERLGAAALRQTSQSIFNCGIYSNIFHDDPRYYVLGPTHPFKKRVVYAATRTFITRKDDGRNATNWALMSAIVSSSVLTNAYYPDVDRDVQRSITGALTSFATRAGTQQLREFSGDIRQRLHRKHTGVSP